MPRRGRGRPTKVPQEGSVKKSVEDKRGKQRSTAAVKNPDSEPILDVEDEVGQGCGAVGGLRIHGHRTVRHDPGNAEHAELLVERLSLAKRVALPSPGYHHMYLITTNQTDLVGQFVSDLYFSQGQGAEYAAVLKEYWGMVMQGECARPDEFPYTCLDKYGYGGGLTVRLPLPGAYAPSHPSSTKLTLQPKPHPMYNPHAPYNPHPSYNPHLYSKEDRIAYATGRKLYHPPGTVADEQKFSTNISSLHHPPPSLSLRPSATMNHAQNYSQAMYTHDAQSDQLRTASSLNRPGGVPSMQVVPMSMMHSHSKIPTNNPPASQAFYDYSDSLSVPGQSSSTYPTRPQLPQHSTLKREKLGFPSIIPARGLQQPDARAAQTNPQAHQEVLLPDEDRDRASVDQGPPSSTFSTLSKSPSDAKSPLSSHSLPLTIAMSQKSPLAAVKPCVNRKSESSMSSAREGAGKGRTGSGSNGVGAHIYKGMGGAPESNSIGNQYENQIFQKYVAGNVKTMKAQTQPIPVATESLKPTLSKSSAPSLQKSTAMGKLDVAFQDSQLRPFPTHVEPVVDQKNFTKSGSFDPIVGTRTDFTMAVPLRRSLGEMQGQEEGGRRGGLERETVEWMTERSIAGYEGCIVGDPSREFLVRCTALTLATLARTTYFPGPHIVVTGWGDTDYWARVLSTETNLQVVQVQGGQADRKRLFEEVKLSSKSKEGRESLKNQIFLLDHYCLLSHPMTEILRWQCAIADLPICVATNDGERKRHGDDDIVRDTWNVLKASRARLRVALVDITDRETLDGHSNINGVAEDSSKTKATTTIKTDDSTSDDNPLHTLCNALGAADQGKDNVSLSSELSWKKSKVCAFPGSKVASGGSEGGGEIKYESQEKGEEITEATAADTCDEGDHGVLKTASPPARNGVNALEISGKVKDKNVDQVSARSTETANGKEGKGEESENSEYPLRKALCLSPISPLRETEDVAGSRVGGKMEKEEHVNGAADGVALPGGRTRGPTFLTDPELEMLLRWIAPLRCSTIAGSLVGDFFMSKVSARTLTELTRFHTIDDINREYPSPEYIPRMIGCAPRFAYRPFDPPFDPKTSKQNKPKSNLVEPSPPLLSCDNPKNPAPAPSSSKPLFPPPVFIPPVIPVSTNGKGASARSTVQFRSAGKRKASRGRARVRLKDNVDKSTETTIQSTFPMNAFGSFGNLWGKTGTTITAGDSKPDAGDNVKSADQLSAASLADDTGGKKGSVMGPLDGEDKSAPDEKSAGGAESATAVPCEDDNDEQPLHEQDFLIGGTSAATSSSDVLVSGVYPPAPGRARGNSTSPAPEPVE